MPPEFNIPFLALCKMPSGKTFYRILCQLKVPFQSYGWQWSSFNMNTYFTGTVLSYEKFVFNADLVDKILVCPVMYLDVISELSEEQKEILRKASELKMNRHKLFHYNITPTKYWLAEGKQIVMDKIRIAEALINA